MKKWKIGLVGVVTSLSVACSSPSPVDVGAVIGEPLTSAYSTLVDKGLNVSTTPDVAATGDTAEAWFVVSADPGEGVHDGDSVVLNLESVLERAAAECKAGESADKGHTLIVDMAGKSMGSGDLDYAQVQ